MSRLALAFSLLVGTAPLVQAAADSELDKPYHLQVVLRIAPHRLLTSIFRDQVERQLGDSLRTALGDLARVEMVRAHPLLKEIEARGLQAALDSYAVLSETKTHFVLIDFIQGRYEIQARQYDGFTGIASPVVRHSSTTDRQLVARSAALLINEDVGINGTVPAGLPKADRVNLTLKGANLGVPLGAWVHKGHVFAVVQVVRVGDQRRSLRMPFTLLHVLEEPQGGACACQILYRKTSDAGPLPTGPGVVGYRCVQLGTTKAPLSLRVVHNDRLKSPVTGVQVRIFRDGFDGNTSENLSPLPDGLVQSVESYENVAFVKIYAGALLARVPVEIVEDLTITCPVDINEAGLAKGQWEERHERWLRHLNDSVLVVGSLIQELNAMAGQPSAQRLARAKEGFQLLEKDLTALSAELQGLRTAPGLPKSQARELTKDDEALQELQSRRESLQRYVATLQENLTKEQDPQRKKWIELVEQAKLQEDAAEYGKAIALYQQVQREGGKTQALQKKLQQLQAAWAVKGPAHVKARAFIYDVWPKQQTAADMKKYLPEARKAFATCKEVGDVLSPGKLLKTYAQQVARLDKEVDALQSDKKEDDRRTAETIIDLTDKLRSFNDDVRDYLRQAKPKDT